MQTLTRTYMVVIEDFDHMAIMDEKVNYTKLTCLLSVFSLNLRAPLLHIYIYFKLLIAFLNVHTRGKQYFSLMYTMYD